jgi:hypothetical protein
MVHERWPHHFFATHFLPSRPRVSSLGGAVSGRFSLAWTVLLGAVSGHGVRPTNLPRESARHRSLSRIKAFFGTSKNAVKTQIWIAISVYVLVAIVRKRLRLESSLYQILQILSIIPFEKTPISQALQSYNDTSDLLDISSQLILFDL